MTERQIKPEGPTCEWKERLPAAKRLSKVICAFGNGVGGVLWIGVRDSGSLLGVPDSKAERAQFERAAQMVMPTPKWAWQRVTLDGVRLVRVQIQRLTSGTCAVHWPGSDPITYVREGASNRPASQATAQHLGAGRKPKVGPKERALIELMRGRDPMALREIAKAMRMGERRARRLLVPLLQAGYIHVRQGKRYATTARSVRGQ